MQKIGEIFMKRINIPVRLILVLALLLVASGALAQDETAEATAEATAGEHLIGAWDTCADPVSLSGTVTIGAVFGLSAASRSSRPFSLR